MTRWKISRAVSLVTAMAAAVCTLAGCSSSASAKTGSSASAIDPDTVFKEIASPLDKPGTIDAADTGEAADEDMDPDSIEYSYVGICGDRYCVACSDFIGEGDISVYFFDAAGEKTQTVTIPRDDSGDMYVSNLTVSPDGKIYTLDSSYDEEKDQSAWEIAAFSVPDQEKGTAEEILRQKFSADDSFYPNGIVSNENNTVVLGGSDVRIFTNSDGKESKKISLPGDDFYGGLCINAKGEILLAGSTSKGPGAYKIDPDAGKMEETKLQAEGFYDFGGISNGSGGYDFYASKEDGVYGFHLDGSDPVKIVDFIASDLDMESVRKCAVLSAESVLVIYYDNEGGSSAALLQKADASALADRVILTLGCTYADSDLRSAVIRFNRENDKYRITIREYPYDEEGNSSLNTEIAAGNVPDILSVTADMPVESYAAKGMFEDLEPMFRADPEISKRKYLDNVIDAFRVDGKMYFVTPSFDVIGLMGRKKDFGDTRGVTIKQLEKMIKERKMSYDTALGLTNRENVMGLVMYFALDQYVDWDNNSCSFDSDSFIDLLEFAKKFPKDINYDKVDWDSYDAGVRAGKQLVRDVYLSDFDSYMNERYGYFGEEVTYMGYPGNGENGPCLIGDLSMAISHSSSDQEGCWAFLRTFYLDEYQEGLSYDFPVSRKALEAKADAAMHPRTYTYTDENGEEVTETNENSLWLAGKEIEIPVPQQKDIDAVVGIIEGINTSAVIDTNISKIINEETGAFFAGQKSAKETADIIQSRVKVYVGETK